MPDELVLTGLNGSNPLAFLAALGTLRLATLRWPDRSVCLSWRQLRGWRPVLSGVTLPESELCEALLVAPSAPVALFDRLGNDLTVSREVFEHFASEARESTTAEDRRPADFAAAFASETCEDSRAKRVQITDFCFITGSGHQHFLGSAKALAAHTKAEHVRDALFGRMAEGQEKYSFRWSPTDAAEYALQWHNPGPQGTKTSWGANRLAFEALPFFPVHPRGKDLVTTGFRNERPWPKFSWPVWSAPLTVDEVRSLLAWAELHVENPDVGHLRALGVIQVFRAARVRIGQGANFKVSFRPARAL